MKWPIRPITDLRYCPLGGAYGLAWYERKPASLSLAEWRTLHEALHAGTILSDDYAEWKLNVR